MVVFPGYTRYWNNLKADAELPSVQQGQTVTLQQAAHEQKQTQPPPRYSEPKLVQVMERKGIGRPSTYAPTIKTLKERLYADARKGQLQPTTLGLDVDAFLIEALPDLLEAEFTAQMERSLDQIATGKEDWRRYLTNWNQEYFAPALARAKKVIPQHLSNASAVSSNGRSLATSKTPCPQCQKPMAKVPHTKVQKKYFLKCVSGCEGSVLFYSKFSKQWEPPRDKAAGDSKVIPAEACLTNYPCPVCQKPMEEYAYEKDGKAKKLLRCSDQKVRSQKKHKDAVYFHTAKGWWSPKYGNLESAISSEK